MDDLIIAPGTFADYAALARFHYKSGHPGGVTSVIRMVRTAPTVVGRFLGRGDETQIVGVVVRSLPALSCQLRNIATNGRYRNLKPRDAARMLNREVRTISRVVIDPQWRGLGLAVRLVRHALENPEDLSERFRDNHRPATDWIPACAGMTSQDVKESQVNDSFTRSPAILYTEALAAMGRVSPFFEQAGMTRYDRPPRQEHARLLDALRHLGLEPFMLASTTMIGDRLASPATNDFLLAELRRWHRAAHRTPPAALRAMPLNELLIAARNELLAQPVYYAYLHSPRAGTSGAPS
jgi:GNAT superfamily N-acetyltransferase